MPHKSTHTAPATLHLCGVCASAVVLHAARHSLCTDPICLESLGMLQRRRGGARSATRLPRPWCARLACARAAAGHRVERAGRRARQRGRRHLRGAGRRRARLLNSMRPSGVYLCCRKVQSALRPQRYQHLQGAGHRRVRILAACMRLLGCVFASGPRLESADRPCAAARRLACPGRRPQAAGAHASCVSMRRHQACLRSSSHSSDLQSSAPAHGGRKPSSCAWFLETGLTSTSPPC